MTDTNPAAPPPMTSHKAWAAHLGVIALWLIGGVLAALDRQFGLGLDLPLPPVADVQSAIRAVIEGAVLGLVPRAVTWLSPANRPKPPGPGALRLHPATVALAVLVLAGCASLAPARISERDRTALACAEFTRALDAATALAARLTPAEREYVDAQIAATEPLCPPPPGPGNPLATGDVQRATARVLATIGGAT